jgi:hypothetical protein
MLMRYTYVDSCDLADVEADLLSFTRSTSR